MSWQFERVAGPYEGEANGVVWADGAVLFALKDEGRILRYDPATRATSELRRYTNRVNGIALGPKGQLYGAQEGGRRLVELMADGRMTEVGALLDGSHHNQPIDLTVDRRGRIWFTDPLNDVLPFGPRFFPMLDHASVLRVARNDRHDWVMSRVTYDTRSPRAVILSADEKLLVVAEGEPKPRMARELRAYPVLDDGTVGAATVLMTFAGDHRGPHRGIEGLARDAGGHIIACGGWRRSGAGPAVYVFSADGRIAGAHAFPGDRPNRCCSGGADGHMLFVTTATGELWQARMG